MGKKDKAKQVKLSKADRALLESKSITDDGVSAKIEPQDVRDVAEDGPPVPADMQATAPKEPRPLMTHPTGKFELISNLTEIQPQLRAYFEKERDVDLTYSDDLPDELTQKVLHDRRAVMYSHGDPVAVAAVEATDPDYEPIDSALLPKPKRVTPVPGAVKGLTAADGSVGVGEKVTIQDLLTDAQSVANRTGQTVVVVAPKRYTTKSYGTTLAGQMAKTIDGLFITHTDTSFDEAAGKFRFDFTVSPHPDSVPAAPVDEFPEALGREGDAVTDPKAKKAKKDKDAKSSVAASLPTTLPTTEPSKKDKGGKKGKKGKK